MMNRRRRDFLRGNWRAVSPGRLGENTSADALASSDEALLPPEFSPGMLRFEGQRLGLPVDTMSEEALIRAVAQALHTQARPPVEMETPQL
ncbi:hypothetical protein [Desulfovibrio sp.]|uniref:hypothetical protein n=1 Tax=Desulfovibrio sp. TaxID=885 RepID=UPI002A362D11|nr:hypothetical protein [Desulfovibrio sp.]MDY0260723.1 hypothetical protein [Desulfovibrio sp.]